MDAGVNMDGYRNDSALSQGTYTYGSSFTDFDNDGWPELLVTADYGVSRLFWNNQNGTFTECTESCGLDAMQNAKGHAIGDWDNDGFLDWFSTAMYQNRSECSMSGCMYVDSGNVLYRYQGGKQFEEATDKAGVENGGMPWGAALMDFDNNGFLDFISTSGNDFNKMNLWQNLGAGQNGKTQEVSAVYGLNGRGKGRGLLKWDYDDDGDEDVIVCNNVGAPFFYQYQQKEPNNWIRVRAVHQCAKNQNKLCDSLGARVQVTMANNHKQTQEIGSSTHFLGQSSRVAHFGLGRNSGQVTVHVKWLSGVTVTYSDVPPDTRLRVLQPDIADSGKTFSYSTLDKCFSLFVTEIKEQPSNSRVTINSDGRTVDLKINLGVEYKDLSNETFKYAVSVMPSPGGQPLNSSTASYVVFTEGTASGCQAGRKIGSTPSVTDGRRLDGTSNNKDHVFWGAILEDVVRDAPAMYADGIVMPAGANRPSPRKISNELFQQTEPKISRRRLSDLHMTYGQFLAHDTDKSPELSSRDFDVTSDVMLPIPVPKGDIHFDRQNKGNVYLPFVRSNFNRCTGRVTSTPRQQINILTSYIDGSVVYGETEERNKALREFKDGKLKTGPGDLLPENTISVSNDNPVGREPTRLFAAGDSRANEQPGLIALHTLFVREHNRLCDEYKGENPQASDEEIFQAVRRLVAAEIQAITFREYLPATLGGTQHIPAYQGYNKNIDVGMSNMMSTAAFRFGHSQVNTHLWRFEEDGTMSHYGHIPLRDVFFSPERVAREGGIDSLFRGAVKQVAQEVDLKMVDAMRNALFPSGPKLGSDLASKNIQRGRDHGLPDYNSARKALDLRGLSSFSEITKDSKTATKIEDLYQDINDIDLWVGGLAEDHESGSELGPTFRAIIMKNFLRIRDGDRFWYERYLSQEEIDKVHSLTLGKIIRLNTEFKSAPDNVFFSTDYCSGVTDFQCVPKTDSTVTEASTSNATRNALIAISVIMFVAIVIIGAVLAYLRFRTKPNKTKVISIKEAEPK
ncbi:thyroid peroxidase-like [Orbicella faveolata]|uniref:thyroid peroxidase-like n=1 Tax=Orbicella faveolata TaxID=48498 RepID=UPI0009E3825D|nr:thyroid peroxidase-like [Orbicella faveolata]